MRAHRLAVGLSARRCLLRARPYGVKSVWMRNLGKADRITARKWRSLDWRDPRADLVKLGIAAAELERRGVSVIVSTVDCYVLPTRASRELEPYSLSHKQRVDGRREEYLRAYERTGGRRSGPGLKSWFNHKIRDLEVLEQRFEPRFPTELAKALARHTPRLHGSVVSVGSR